eukprot:5921573-Pyramimonas_sp.AAC.2
MPIHTIPTSHEVTECTACSVQILLPRAGVTGAPAEGCLKDAKEEQAAEEEGQEGESSRPVHSTPVYTCDVNKVTHLAHGRTRKAKTK